MTRKYEMKRRARRQEETRQRITEAAVELHQALGPANITISAVAERERVQRLTVYKKNWSGANGPGSSLDSSDEAFSDADLLRECLRPGSDQKCLGGYPFHTNFTEILP